MHAVFPRSRSVHIIVGALLATACDSTGAVSDASRSDSAQDMATSRLDGALTDRRRAPTAPHTRLI